MKWEGNRESDNVEDRRGGGGLVGGMCLFIGTIVLAILGWAVFGVNPLTTIGVLNQGQAVVQRQPQA